MEEKIEHPHLPVPAELYTALLKQVQTMGLAGQVVQETNGTPQLDLTGFSLIKEQAPEPGTFDALPTPVKALLRTTNALYEVLDAIGFLTEADDLLEGYGVSAEQGAEVRAAYNDAVQLLLDRGLQPTTVPAETDAYVDPADG